MPSVTYYVQEDLLDLLRVCEYLLQYFWHIYLHADAVMPELRSHQHHRVVYYFLQVAGELLILALPRKGKKASDDPRDPVAFMYNPAGEIVLPASLRTLVDQQLGIV